MAPADSGTESKSPCLARMSSLAQVLFLTLVPKRPSALHPFLGNTVFFYPSLTPFAPPDTLSTPPASSVSKSCPSSRPAHIPSPFLRNYLHISSLL